MMQTKNKSFFGIPKGMNKKGSWWNPFSRGKGGIDYPTRFRRQVGAAYQTELRTFERELKALVPKGVKISIWKRQVKDVLTYRAPFVKSVSNSYSPVYESRVADVIGYVNKDIIRTDTKYRTVMTSGGTTNDNTYLGGPLGRSVLGGKRKEPEYDIITEKSRVKEGVEKIKRFHYIIVPMANKKNKIPYYFLFRAQKPGDKKSPLGRRIKSSPKLSDLCDYIISRHEGEKIPSLGGRRKKRTARR